MSRLEFSLQKVDFEPDPVTGFLQITYRSDPRRRHKLLSNGGHVEIKVGSVVNFASGNLFVFYRNALTMPVGNDSDRGQRGRKSQSGTVF